MSELISALEIAAVIMVGVFLLISVIAVVAVKRGDAALEKHDRS